MRLFISRLVLWLCGLLPASFAGAAAAHPDITGMWQFEFSGWNAAAPPNAPELMPAARALVKKRVAAESHGYVRSVQNILCLPTAFPIMMMWRSPILITQAPEKILITTEHDPGNDEPRTLYLNETIHPPNADETWNGHSIAHWDGDALIVDTIDFNERGELFAGVPRSESTHIVERFHETPGGKFLIDDMIITDPTILISPWHVSMKFDRMPEDTERLEAVCEPDLDALKTLDLSSVKDTDPEAARLLDPSLHYNAFGNQFSKETK